MSFVKRDLGQYNQRDVNGEEILFAINQGQEDIIMNENILQVNITVPMVNAQAQYPLYYTPLLGVDPVPLAIVKRVISIRYPDGWPCTTIFKTSQQLDEIITEDPDITDPMYVTIRPLSMEYGTQYIEFFGAPVIGTTPLSVKLQCELSRQVYDASDIVELTVPVHYDTALRYFAVEYLLPLDSPIRQIANAKYVEEINKLSGKFLNLDSYSRSPDCKW